MPVTTQGADLAEGIITQLGDNFSLPSVDLTTVVYDLPDQVGNTLYDEVGQIEVGDLTTGVEGGAGAFDKIMASNKAHILGEYESGRITGDQYAKAYIELTTAALSSGVQMVLGRDQAYWQAHIAQSQGRKAEIEAVTASVQLAAAKAQLATLHYQAQEAETRAVLTKMQLATEDAKYRLTNEQYVQAAFTSTHIQPIQKELAATERDQSLFTEQYMQPLQRDLATEQKDQAAFTTTFMQPLQKTQLEAQVSQAEYTVNSFLPAQKNLVDEQVESKRADTSDTRSDGTSIVGTAGKQKDLYTQQIDSYQKDSAYKVAKLFADGFTVQKTMDENLQVPANFEKTQINNVLNDIRNGVNLGS
jgi:hypothetical protein